MSELSFLLILLLDHKLPKPVKDLIKDRIKEIEAKPQQARSVSIPVLGTIGAQAPSTIANLEREQVAQAPQAPLPPITNRIVGGEVDTGRGTRGPRKF